MIVALNGTISWQEEWTGPGISGALACVEAAEKLDIDLLHTYQDGYIKTYTISCIQADRWKGEDK